MTYATALTTPTPNPAVESARTPSLENDFQAALEHARRLTDMYGTDAVDVAIAWETVEELAQARRQAANTQSAFERYCERYPDAPECRCYDV